MALRLVQVNIKAVDDAAAGRFWGAALGWPVRSAGGATSVAPAGFDWTAPDAPVCVDIIAVPAVPPGKNRVHIDLASTSSAHQAELVQRLTGLGATPVEVGQGADVPWTVLADPEGTVFCVLGPRDLYRDTGPIAAVVVDCADPVRMARFWSEAVGWTVHGATEEQAWLRAAAGTGPFLEFIRTPDPKTGWDRVHLDVVPYAGSDQSTEVARLRSLGATPADVGQGDVPWIVLADPEGNEFCVLAPG